MLTGHGRLKAYYHRFKIIEVPSCTYGAGSQTAHHLLYDCKLYNKKRTQLRDIIKSKGVILSINKNQIVQNALVYLEN